MVAVVGRGPATRSLADRGRAQGGALVAWWPPSRAADSTSHGCSSPHSFASRSTPSAVDSKRPPGGNVL